MTDIPNPLLRYIAARYDTLFIRCTGLHPVPSSCGPLHRNLSNCENGRKDNRIGLSRLPTNKPGFLPGFFRFRCPAYRLPSLLRELHHADSRSRASRRALPITLTDDNAIAAAPIAGDSSRPKAGYKIPAAIGTPAAL